MQKQGKQLSANALTVLASHTETQHRLYHIDCVILSEQLLSSLLKLMSLWGGYKGKFNPEPAATFMPF